MTVTDKAKRLLAFARVMVIPGERSARVCGNNACYKLALNQWERWECNCPHQPRKAAPKCSHIVAVEMAVERIARMALSS